MAKLASAHGMNVIGVNTKGGAVPFFHEVYDASHINEAIKTTSAIVICLPLTTRTRGLVGGSILNAASKNAFLINVGRDELVDNKALALALKSGQISWAALDIDPPGRKHPCFGLPNVLFTNHSAFLVDEDEDLMFKGLIENIDHFVLGEELDGLIDLSKGY